MTNLPKGECAEHSWFWWVGHFGKAIFACGLSCVSRNCRHLRSQLLQLVSRLSLLLGKWVPFCEGLSIWLLEHPCDWLYTRESESRRQDFPGSVSINSCVSWFFINYLCLLVGLDLACWMLDTKYENLWKYVSFLPWSLSLMKMCFSLLWRYLPDKQVISVPLGLSRKTLGPCCLVPGSFLRIWQVHKGTSFLKALNTMFCPSLCLSAWPCLKISKCIKKTDGHAHLNAFPSSPWFGVSSLWCLSNSKVHVSDQQPTLTQVLKLSFVVFCSDIYLWVLQCLWINKHPKESSIT